MPHRSYASTANYRFGFNGQEMNNESKGLGNSYNALYWEYDSRLGIRWNLDPVLKTGESPYSTFSNNPILRSDPNGDRDSTGKPESPAPKTPLWSIHIGETGGPWGTNKQTSIISLYGNVNYYNSTPNGEPGGLIGLINNITEPNAFIQIQRRVGGDNSKTQIGINWMKQKFENKDGFGYEAPTAVHINFAFNKNLLNIDDKINIKGNLSFGAGIELGKPRFDDPTITYPRKLFRPLGYSIIGLGASAMYRVDAVYSQHYSFFIAGIIHHLQTFNQESSIGTQQGKSIGSAAITAGIGINLGTSR